MDDNRTSKLIGLFAMASWLMAGKKFLRDMSSFDSLRGGKSVYHRNPRGARPVTIYCCRCGDVTSYPLKVAYENVKKVDGVKVRTKYYIHEGCEHG